MLLKVTLITERQYINICQYNNISICQYINLNAHLVLPHEIPLKMMKNAFYFTLKALRS